MSRDIALVKRASAVLAAAGLLAAAIGQLLLAGSAQAAQVTRRSITMSTSVASATSASYAVSFRPSTVSGTGSDDILGIAIEFCSNSPLVGSSCTAPAGMVTPTGGTVNVTHNSNTVGFTVDADATGTDSDGTGLVLLTDATGLTSINASSDLTFTLTGITNTSAVGTFYARVVTYNTEAGLDGYTDTAPGTHLDDGGVALSTARQLTVNARVQEQLEFCVAAIDGTIDTDGEAPANCSAADFNGTNQTVDIGVVDSGAASISPVAATNGGNDRNGAAMIRTNAVNGAAITYFAEQNNSSGSLKVVGAACGSTTYGSGSVTDQCFNSAGTTQQSLAAAGEGFGMTSSAVLRPTGSTTTNLTRDGEYDGDGTAAGGFAWDDTGTADVIATSSTVLDYEMAVLRFAARAAATTPTGSYSVTSTYIATATF